MTSLTVPQTEQEELIKDAETINYGMLLATDRCDWCGAQAYVRFVHPSASAWHGVLNQDLLFCGHHGERVSKSGKLDEWSVMDERSKLSS